MKKIIIIAAILVLSKANAQINTLYNWKPCDSIRFIRHDIEKCIGSNFIFDGIDSLNDGYKERIGLYFFDTVTKKELIYQYVRVYRGPDLKAYISDPMFTGDFQPLLLLWKKIFNPLVDEKKLLLMEDDKIAGVRFGKYAYEWAIFNYP
ncbi:MAG TPA: hypothetical protein PKC39_14630 [Ferruginibacter sp.]|nr:hypothetical protein [Ferruginibacter sp.]HMP22192.1 hypothetical protein [Ferruginibacter sp.]